MAEMTVIEAVRSALREEMERDERVFVMGEDVGTARRRVPGHPGVHRGLRSAAGDGHPAGGSVDYGDSSRRRVPGDASDTRSPVLRFRCGPASTS